MAVPSLTSEECLNLVAKGVLVRQMVKESLRDFPKTLDDRHGGNVKGRIALISEEWSSK